MERVKDLTPGAVSKTLMDDTLPDGPNRRNVEYHAPFYRLDREWANRGRVAGTLRTIRRIEKAHSRA
jgi:hypothetical protein